MHGHSQYFVLPEVKDKVVIHSHPVAKLTRLPVEFAPEGRRLSQEKFRGQSNGPHASLLPKLPVLSIVASAAPAPHQSGYLTFPNGRTAPAGK